MDNQDSTAADVALAAQPGLFGEAPDFTPSRAARVASTAPAGKPRLQRADGAQAAFRTVRLDDWLPEDHPARLVWAFVEPLDVDPLLDPIRATEHRPGQPHIDPRLLLALWLLATIEGVGSARRLAQRADKHLAYLWLLGGVTVNYHTLSTFRVAHGAFLDQLLTDSLASLLAEGRITLQRTAQDGMRVRANAGTSSFRSRERLLQFQAEAGEHVRELKGGTASGSHKSFENSRFASRTF